MDEQQIAETAVADESESNEGPTPRTRISPTSTTAVVALRSGEHLSENRADE